MTAQDSGGPDGKSAGSAGAAGSTVEPAAATYLYSAPVREAMYSDHLRLERFFCDETLRLRRTYLTLGVPSFVYASGIGLHELSTKSPIGIACAGVYEAFMAEMLIAQGANSRSLRDALHHLETAERHISTARVTEAQRARVLAKVFWLKAIIEKSLGDQDSAVHTLRSATNDRWWDDNADWGDVVAITRQEAMMRQSIAAHLLLAEQAPRYRNTRPIEYFRTLKRTFEVLTNQQMVESAQKMRPHVVHAYARVSNNLPLLSRISLAKNLAQVNALSGNTTLALDQLQVVRSHAVRLGLHGQVRQVDELDRHIRAAELRDALETFRIAN